MFHSLSLALLLTHLKHHDIVPSIHPAACISSLPRCVQNISHLPGPHCIMELPLSHIPQTCLFHNFILWMAPEHTYGLPQSCNSFLTFFFSSSYPPQPILSWVSLIPLQIPILNLSASVHCLSCSHHQVPGISLQPRTLLPHEPTSNSLAPVIFKSYMRTSHSPFRIRS